MKLLTSLAVMAVSAMVGTNSFAFEINKGKLIEEKEWKTGKIKVTYHTAQPQPANLKPLLNKRFKLASQEPVPFIDRIASSVRIMDVDTTGVDGYNTAYGYANARIYNSSGETRTYTVTTSSCLTSIYSSSEPTCSVKKAVLMLDSDGFAYYTIDPKIYVPTNEGETNSHYVYVNLEVYQDGGKSIFEAGDGMYV